MQTFPISKVDIDNLKNQNFANKSVQFSWLSFKTYKNQNCLLRIDDLDFVFIKNTTLALCHTALRLVW